MGLERWSSNQKHWLFFHRTRVRFPAPTRWLRTVYNSSSKRFHVLFWPLGAPDMYAVHRPTQDGKTAKYMKQINKTRLKIQVFKKDLQSDATRDCGEKRQRFSETMRVDLQLLHVCACDKVCQLNRTSQNREVFKCLGQADEKSHSLIRVPTFPLVLSSWTFCKLTGW